MKKVLIILITSAFLLSSCSDTTDSGPTEDPSIINIEKIQTEDNHNFGIFSGPIILKRTERDSQPPDEQKIAGSIYDIPDDDPDGGLYLSVSALGNGLLDDLKEIRFSFYYSGEKLYTSTYGGAEQISFYIEANDGTTLRGGYQYSTTEVKITILEVTDTWLKGSFTGELDYFNSDGSRNTEISDTIGPVINGTFEVYRY